MMGRSSSVKGRFCGSRVRVFFENKGGSKMMESGVQGWSGSVKGRFGGSRVPVFCLKKGGSRMMQSGAVGPEQQC